MGLAKEVVTEVQPVEQSQPVSDGTFSGRSDIVHPEVYKYFNVSSLEGGADLTGIVQWASEGSKSPAHTLKKIKDLEVKLGQPNSGETRLTKINNWIRITKNIKDVSLSYKQEIGSAKEAHQKLLSEIKINKGSDMEKLNGEIERIQSKYKNSYQQTRARSMNEMSNLKSEYERQLKELKDMRTIYQRGK